MTADMLRYKQFLAAAVSSYLILELVFLQEDVAKEFGIPVEFQRFWIWAKRQNHTYRPNRPLTLQEELQTVILLSCRTISIFALNEAKEEKIES